MVHLHEQIGHAGWINNFPFVGKNLEIHSDNCHLPELMKTLFSQVNSFFLNMRLDYLFDCVLRFDPVLLHASLCYNWCLTVISRL